MDTSTGADTPTGTAAAGSSERRRSPRVHFETALSVSSESNFYTGFTSDISEGGVFVVTYQLHEVGTKVSLELDLPGDHEIRVSGTVRWVRDPRNLGEETTPGMGIEFDELDHETHAVISEFVENRAPDFHDA